MAVRHVAGFAPACFAVTWLLHTRHIMQRMTSGLPRGWAAPVLAAYLYFALRGSHRGVLLTILAGALLHPPATLLITAAYGLYLLWGLAWRSTRERHLKPFYQFICLAPIFVLVTYLGVRRPPEIGTMASYAAAEKMPEFSYPKGRFPFVPLRPAHHEIKSFAFQAFVGRFYNPGRFLKRHTWWIASLLVLCFGWLLAVRARPPWLPVFGAYLAAVFLVYFASRVLAFRLYVPDRHLQFPMGIFFVSFLTVAVWQSLQHTSSRLQRLKIPPQGLSVVGVLLLGLFVYFGSGTGLYGAANFNYSLYKHGHVFAWAKKYTPENSLIAGHPTMIDAMQLFGMRRAYVTTETAHPFYDRYYAEMKRRIEISLRAHFAADLGELVPLLESEGITHFVFRRREFGSLEKATYFEPFNALVKELAARRDRSYAYFQLPGKVDLEHFPFMPFRDREAAVVDIAKLRNYLGGRRFAEALSGSPGRP